jgi:fatty-acyl-CoA synthase
MNPLSAGPTIGSLVIRALRRYPGRTAFTDGGTELTYAQAADLIGRYQRAYDSLGLRRGQHVAFLSANRPDAWCAGIAAQASGMAITWLHGLGSAADHLYQLADCGAAALIVDEHRHAARGAELAAAAGGEVKVLSIGPSGFAPDLAAVADRAGPSRPWDLAAGSDIAFIAYTGGTTGHPKGVMRRHRATSAMFAPSILAGFELPRTPRYLSVAPMSHVGGTKLLAALLLGGSVHMQAGFDPGAVLDAIGRHRINTTLLVPTMIYALLDDPALNTADLSSLELLLYGAAPMAPSRLAEGLTRIGPVFAQLYGQTECYPISALPAADHRLDEPGLFSSCGAPVPTCAVMLAGADGEPVADGEVGEIWVRSPAVMDEYWNLPELTAETTAGGWLHTGDLARRDERGYLYIADRKKDLIISGGFNVYPREVEDALTAHPAIREASVFGSPDDHWGEIVTAVVVLRPGAQVLAAELREHVKKLKGSFQAPKVIHIADGVPRTPLGKIDRQALRRRYGAGGPAGS